MAGSGSETHAFRPSRVAGIYCGRVARGWARADARVGFGRPLVKSEFIFYLRRLVLTDHAWVTTTEFHAPLRVRMGSRHGHLGG